MEKFVELIQRVLQELFHKVVDRVQAKKIPAGLIYRGDFPAAVQHTKNLREMGLNITHLLLVTDVPAVEEELEFKIINTGQAAALIPQLEYIFANEITAARVAARHVPKAKVLTLAGLTDDVYETFMNHLVELREVYASLIDDESRRAFYGYWLGNISRRFDSFVFANMPHYLAAGFIPEPGAIVIDCGTCDGGTAERFVNLGCKVYGFEMDAKNFEIAKKVADERGFVVENLGLGSYRHEMKFSRDEGNIGGSKLDANGTETAQIVKLDTYVGEKGLPRVDFIKMDVEGAELDILRGAEATIARWKPILALSAYHKWDDFWTLMNFVKSIRPDYEFALRHYPETREDVPFMFTDSTEDGLINLGLEPDYRTGGEIVLLAR